MREEIILDITVESGDLRAQFARITSELEQNRTKLASVRREIKELTAAQKQLDDGLKSGKLSQEAYGQQAAILAQRANALGEASANLILRQKELVQDQRNVARQIKLTDKALQGQGTSLNALSAQLAAAIDKFDRLSKEERESEQNGKKLLATIQKLNTEVSDLEKSTGRSQRGVGSYTESIKNAASQIPGLGGAVSALSGGPLVAGAAAVVAVGAALKASVDLAREFQQNVTVLGVIAGATAPELESLSEAAKSIGASTQFTATEVVELQTELARLGFTVPEILASTKAIGDLAIITQEDLGSSAETVAQVINAYGLAASDATEVTNILAEGFNRTSLDLSKFDFALRQVGPTAAAVGIDLAGTTAAIGALTDIGLTGEQAGTGLRNTLINLADANSKLGQRVGFSVKSSEDLTKALGILKTQSITVAEAADLVGKEGASSLLGLINNTEKVNDLFNKFSNVEADAAAKAAAKVGDTLDGDLKRAASAVQGLALEVGEALTPAVRFFVQLFTDGLTEVIETIKDVQFVFKTVGQVVDDIKEPIIGAFAGIKAAINAIGGPIKTIFDLLSAVVGKIQEAGKFALDLINPFKQAGAAFRSFGIRDARQASETAAANAPAATATTGARPTAPASVDAELETLEKTKADRQANADKSAAARQKREQEASKARQAAIKEEIAALDLLLLTTAKNSLAGLEIQKQRIAAETKLKLEATTGSNAQALVQAEADLEIQKLAARQEAFTLGIAPIQARQIEATKLLADNTVAIQRDAAFNQVAIAQNVTAQLKIEDDKRLANARLVADQRKQLNQEVSNQVLGLAQEGVSLAAKLLVKNKDDEKANARASLIASYVNELGAIAFRAAQNPANAATAGAAGLTQFAVLSGIATARLGLGLVSIAKLNRGGLVPGTGNTDTVPALLTPGEVVVNKRAAAMFAPALDFMQRTTGGRGITSGTSGPRFNTGGLVASRSTREMDAEIQTREVFKEAILNMPVPEVSVREIDRVKKRVEVKERIRRLS